MHTRTTPQQTTQRLNITLACTALLLMLAGCTTMPSSLELPPSPEQAWQANSTAWSLGNKTDVSPAPLNAPQVFSIPAVPDLTLPKAAHSYAANTPLGLPQLIDIAQRENPSTRQAWNRAKEAALSVGLTDALFLPSLTASIIAGEQKLRVPVELPFNQGEVHVNNTLHGVTPFLTLTWLLFDFGERDALREGAQYTALAANVLFNAAHQKLIRDVTDAFYRYNAARTNATLAKESLTHHQQVLAAVEARQKAGLATRIDIALAQQALAQGRLNVVTHEGLARTSYLSLLGALGLPPDTQLPIAEPALDTLPPSVTQLTQERIESVIAQRADIAAAYAALKVSEAGKQAAQAAFMPKVYLGAGLARNRSSFEAGNLPGIGTQNAASGVLLGISVPLYDAGLRATQRSKAELAHEQARTQLEHLQMTAVREIVAAEQALRTALESHDAAQELVQTASVVYEAALESYRVGRSSTVLLTESAIQLNKARQARAEAQYASIAAAANLAFVMGTMVSQSPDWWPQSDTQRPAANIANRLPQGE